MMYVGIDQHKRFSQVALVDDAGRTVSETKLYHDDRERMRAFFNELAGSPSALEATRNWDWLWEMLEDEGLSPVLSNPLRTRLIAEAKVKTDKVDARTLAQLLRTGFLPTVHVLPRAARNARELHRFRQRLVRLRTRLRNQVHAILDRQGIPTPDASDLFGKQGRAFLDGLALGDPYDLELSALLSLHDEIDRQIRRVMVPLRRTLKRDPRAANLLSIPGIGEVLGYLILFEIGEIGRFPSAKHFGSYCALVPSTRQSADRLWQGRTSRQGNLYLKWALVEAAHTARKKDPDLGDLYSRLRRTKGSQKAIVAVARRLSTIVYRVLSEKRMYRTVNRLSGRPDPSLGRR
jgi:transposase